MDVLVQLIGMYVMYINMFILQTMVIYNATCSRCTTNKLFLHDTIDYKMQYTIIITKFNNTI